MMYFVILVAIFSFGSSILHAGDQVSQPSDTPDFYKNDDHNFLPAGVVTRAQILTLKVFNYHYVEYVPKSDPVQAIHDFSQPVEIKVFFGDWCSDSKKHVPALIKTLEFADNVNISVTYINVTRDKKNPADLLAGWNITLLPTIIVLQNGTEVGRIVETPRSGVDEDLNAILTTISPSAQ